MKHADLRTAMRLYAVTDRAWLNGGSLATQVEQAICGGATCIQLREKNLPHGEFLAEALRVKPVCNRHNVPFLINDDVGIALACGADGVHVGQDDIPARDVRALIGPEKILGVSANSVEQALAAQAAGADYLGVGAVFSTSTKLDADSVSRETLREICGSVSIPVVAIGGISTENIPILRGTGIDGIAAVSALFSAPDIRAAAETLRSLSESVARQPLKLAGAIFDMDGTLTDSMPLWDNVGGRFLAARGLEAHPGMYEELKPLSMMQTAAYLRKTFGLPQDETAIISELNGMVENGYRETVPPKRDVAQFLSRLREAGVSMCVATATDRHLAEAALRRTGLLDFFQCILTCTEVGAGKEQPDIFELACRCLGTPKEDTVVFEDALHAVKTAKGAGFRVVAIQDDSCKEDAMEIKRVADLYIHRYGEVLI